MVRLAQENDAGQINRIRKETFELHTKALPEVFKVSWRSKQELEFVKSAIKDENFLAFVFEQQGEIVGYALIEKKEKLDRGAKVPRRWCHLSDFGVTEEVRGKGVGTEFLTAIKGELKNQGYLKFELNVWEFNKSAVRFYEKNGFKTVRRIMEADL